jgi:hypothetical protein
MKKYVHRKLEKELKAAVREFPVVVLTGPRQTGKSTLLQQTFPKYYYVTLDDPLTRKLANDDPYFFLTRAKKMLIDEMQYMPELPSFIKIIVDRSRHYNGHFILTGSQYFPLMAGVSESLAGRVALYELLGFSTEELPKRRPSGNIKAAFKSMFNGFYPEIVVHGADRNRFYSSYLQTYLERDIRQITSVHDLKVFQNFLELLAGRAGGLLNLNEISKECGVSFTSVRRWLSLLENTRIVYLLRPFTSNISKRIVKSPKLYFTDTGLLAYLLRYPSSSTMQTGPQAGAFFENFVLMEILKYKFNRNLNFEIYFYRDSNYNEIDIVLDFGVYFKLLEIKSTATPREEHFSTIKKIITKFKNAEGYLVSFSDEKVQAARNITMLPWTKITTILGK